PPGLLRGRQQGPLPAVDLGRHPGGGRPADPATGHIRSGGLAGKRERRGDQVQPAVADHDELHEPAERDPAGHLLPQVAAGYASEGLAAAGSPSATSHAPRAATRTASWASADVDVPRGIVASASTDATARHGLNERPRAQRKTACPAR